MVQVRRLLAGLLSLLLLTGPAWAQATGQPVQTVPYPATTLGGNASGTITVTGTFQKVFAASTMSAGSLTGIGMGQRHGCLVQNNSTTNPMYVNEGTPLADATESNTQVIPAGGTFTCERDGVVLTGEIDITGTAADKFYAVQY